MSSPPALERRPSIKKPVGGGGDDASKTLYGKSDSDPKVGIERRPSVTLTGTPVGGGGDSAATALYGSPSSDKKKPK